MPANAASVPRARSSSIGWPQLSWHCSISWFELRITDVTRSWGHCFAERSATASSAMRGACFARSHFSAYSQPAVFWLRPPEPGYVRICCSPSPTDSAAIDAPVSYSVCAMSAPSLETNSFSSRQISYEARVVRSDGWACRIAASASTSSCTRSSKRMAQGSISIGVVYVAVTGFTAASRASWSFVIADARATSTASAATRSASAAVRIGDAAKPQAPSAIARTEKP